jgi:hypothetical protein
LVGSARQIQEEIVVAALGSLYKGEVLYSLTYMGLTGPPFSRSRDCACFLPTPTIQTLSSMYSLFLAIVLFPQVRRRTQAELDLVIGETGCPRSMIGRVFHTLKHHVKS